MICYILALLAVLVSLSPISPFPRKTLKHSLPLFSNSLGLKTLEVQISDVSCDRRLREISAAHYVAFVALDPFVACRKSKTAFSAWTTSPICNQ